MVVVYDSGVFGGFGASPGFDSHPVLIICLSFFHPCLSLQYISFLMSGEKKGCGEYKDCISSTFKSQMRIMELRQRMEMHCSVSG